MAPGGYFGAALVLDVHAAGVDASRIELSEHVLRSYLGGVGLGTWLLHELSPAGVDPLAPEAPLALRRLEWEHIHRVLTECDGNISETARRLGMHRRTLQRKLSKHPVRERPDRDD